MMDNDFDPYDALIQLNERLHAIEKAHNNLAHAFQKTENEVTIALHSLRNLQQRHLGLLKRFEEQEKLINTFVRTDGPGV